MPAANISEFELIARYFKRVPRHAVLGVGDDAAIVEPGSGMQLLASTDMLVAGTHFFPDAEPESLGWKTLAVNVSDLAAMGAAPRWALLAIALPTVDEAWIAAFARGFFACADAFGIDLIGGDTTRGPMNFCVSIFGEAPAGKALLRSGARSGDDIWVSGQPGRAALGLAHLQGRCVLAHKSAREACLLALHRPQPRLRLGLALRGIASAAIDISDGLLADLGHLLEQSRVAADIELDCLPSPLKDETLPESLIRDCLLAGGDDYELLFAAAPAQRPVIEALSIPLQLALTRIGSFVPQRPEPIQLRHAKGRMAVPGKTGYDHFR